MPGEKTSTREEPAASIYALTWDAEAKEGIIDAAIWVGFAWADEPRCKAAVVVTGWDPALVNEGARRLAEAYWQARDQFEFVAPTGSMGECLEHARRAARPYFISDTGDNPGAGGAGDGTSALGELAKWQRSFEGGRALFASIVDPVAVAKCVNAGEGADVKLQVGGLLDKNAPPVLLSGRVLALSDTGRGGQTAVVRSDALDLIITSRREQYAQLKQYLDAGVDPREYDVVVVKIGYLEPDLHQMAADWMMALTPGGVDQDLVRLGHRSIDRPMIPFDQMEDADFTVRF